MPCAQDCFSPGAILSEREDEPQIRPNALKSMDFPAPVSPVTAVMEGSGQITASRIGPKFFISSSSNILFTVKSFCGVFHILRIFCAYFPRCAQFCAFDAAAAAARDLHAACFCDSVFFKADCRAHFLRLGFACFFAAFLLHLLPAFSATGFFTPSFDRQIKFRHQTRRKRSIRKPCNAQIVVRLSYLNARTGRN